MHSAQGGVHDGPFNDLPMPGIDTRPLLQRFETLWSSRKFPVGSRLASKAFSDKVNVILARVMASELPQDVKRNLEGDLGLSDIITHVDHFRAVLARLDKEDA